MSQKYEFVEYKEIDVKDISNNPLNPRPTFHLKDDDPYILSLGDSIKTDGQHRPALVYEIIDHHAMDDQPGKYMLLQGETRWRSAMVAEVDKLRCFVTKAPSSESLELEWLGNEEAFKRDWQDFFKLRYCVQLAESLDVELVSTEIANKTGVSISMLRKAQKVFKLEPEIQAACAEYEEHMYNQLVTGKRQKGSRLSGSNIRTTEFPVYKAAIVYDLFEVSRKNIPEVVRRYDDLELQRIIAVKASRTNLKDLEQLLSQIKAVSTGVSPGLILKLSQLFDNETKTVKTTLSEVGAKYAKVVDSVATQSARLSSNVKKIIDNSDQIGSDAESLMQARISILELQRDLMTAERVLAQTLEKVSDS